MFKFIPQTESIKVDILKCLIYGEPGIGKSSLSFTSSKPLLLDFDRGLQRACYRLDAIQVNSWEDVIELQKSKELTQFAPQTIVCDTVGTMLDNYIATYVKKEDPKNSRRGGELSLQGYGAMKNVFQQFFDWSISKRINLIFIAHLTEEREGDNVKYIPKVTGGSYDILRQTMDLIGYMESNQNKRVIDFAPKDRHIGKDCAEIGQIEVTDYRKPEYKTFLQDIIDRTLARMNKLSENQVEVMKKIEAFQSVLTDLSPEGCNSAIDLLKSEEAAIRVQMFEILKMKAFEAGTVYNAKVKKFELAETSADVQN